MPLDYSFVALSFSQHCVFFQKTLLLEPQADQKDVGGVIVSRFVAAQPFMGIAGVKRD